MKPLDRLRKYGHVFYGGAENIAAGKTNAVETILSLIIDDGVPTRGHRQNIYAPAHRMVGVATVPHAIYGSFSVINYSFYFVNRKETNKVQQIIDEWNREDQGFHE